MHSKERLRRRFLEKISFSKSKHREVIDHHTRHLSLIEQPKPQYVPNPTNDIEIYGFTQAGSGPNKTECQDTFSILCNLANHINFFAVYDGHGPNGKLVSEFVKKNMAGSLTRHALEMEQAVDMGSPGTFFNTMFKSVDNKLMQSTINASFSGSCCISVLISNNKCYVANVGDSRAILCRETPLGQISVLDLSTDHKPTRQDEQARIFQAGGIIEPSYSNGQPSGPLRVWSQNRESGLATTRAFGDAKGKQAGLIAEPEITQLDLGADDRFIIIASDGVWDVMSSQEAVCFVVNYLKAGKSKSEAAQTLALEAKERWSKNDAHRQIQYCDDITVVVAFLKYNPPQIVQGSYMDLNTQAQVYMP